ncbi:ABC transporter ATP-binding protein [Streptomyces sp. SBT349]|uniref:ABC transporter ATP-binding protein n=1 Tax=Streptomyces sp. SBT349 TaxID=1580539 RepID=UPI00066A85C4|nr:ABC transporter ATP-binding protein [Streptomyces sp. SBT349]
MSEAIQIEGLIKTFGRTRALDGLDMTVRTGEVHGFLGPNGAGKTTTLRVLLGLMNSDAGTVRLLGDDPWEKAVELHRRLAYVPGDVTLWPNLTGGEVIDLLGRLRGTAEQRQRKDALIERFQLDPTKKSRTYSKGNRQKVVLIATLVSDVELLLLDEPTSGLDPLMDAVFRECIADEKAKGRTILLSSHILSEVEALCDRVSIIRAGRIVETGSLAELRHLTRVSVTALVTSSSADLASRPGVHDLTTDGDRVRCQVDSENIGDVVGYLGTLGLRDITTQPPTLEELFIRHYRTTDVGAGDSAAVAR